MSDRRQVLQEALAAIERLESRLATSEGARHEPLAIVGAGCRYPGGVEDPEGLWNLVRRGVDAVVEVPPDRWDVDAYYSPDPKAPGKMITRRGGFLPRVDLFDPQFFGISPREATTMDPQQRLLLETAQEALESAAIAPDRLAGTSTGVFVGITTSDYAQLLRLGGPEHSDVYAATGGALNAAAGRIAYTFGLQGPCVSVDTACSSSLVAVHLACQSLRAGESDLALAGGVNVVLSPDAMVLFSKWGMMAPDGACKTFDAAADGFVRAEGCAVIALKRLSDALTARDPILAVIRGSAVNSDGRSSGLTVPNGLAQQAVIRKALANAGLQPADVDYVEAHGTGTSLGDPIEVEALGAVLGQGRPPERPLLIGSVKTNIGHAEAASGVAGLLKVVMSLRHEAIPPHLHFSRPNPRIPWGELPVAVPTALTPWPRSARARRAGVSAFGFSGTNAHVLLEEAPLPPLARPAAPGTPFVVPLSARDEAGLREVARRTADFLAANPDTSLADVARAAGTGRAHLVRRLAVVADSTPDLARDLRSRAEGQATPSAAEGAIRPGERPKIAFLFTGQGAQYAGMGRGLYDHEPVFRAALDHAAAILAPQLGRPLLDVLYPADGASTPLGETAFTQPALFAVEYALAELWRSWGVTPSIVAGHSVGEYVAACVAGVMSLEDGLGLIAERGRLMQALPQGGGMAAVFADEASVAARIARFPEQLAVAGVNGPEETVISGALAALAQVLAGCAADGVTARPLEVSHAFHSPLLDPMLDALERRAGAVRMAAPRIQLVSNVTGSPFPPGTVPDARYWRRHAREPVRFAACIAALRAAGATALVEIGPHPTLLALAARAAPGAEWTIKASLRRGRADRREMRTALASLFVRGAPVSWEAVNGGDPGQRLSLPTYPFQRQRYWLEAGPEAGHPGAAPAGHPLLGERCELASAPGTHVWNTQIGLDTHPWLRDHRVQGTAIVPATAFIEMSLAAGGDVLGPGPLVVQRIENVKPLVLHEGERRSLQASLVVEPGGAARFAVHSRSRREPGLAEDAGPVGLELVRPGTPDGIELRPRHRAALRPDEVRLRVLAAGLNFRDVLLALGMYPGDGIPFGAECAGVVVEAGESSGLVPGARVFGFAPGSMATEVTVPAAFLAPVPANMTAEDAAGLPVAFLTAWYGLHRLAGLRAGQRVLIHAAAGGVGLAAVQLARRAGAEVFATAGSPAKRDLLAALGVRHVMDSRSLSFRDEILAATGGQGVDVVLNSLAGDFVTASLDALAPGGCFLEMGKRDHLTPEEAARLRPGVRYHAFDLGAEAVRDRGLLRPMLDDLLAAIGRGELRPLPVTVYPLEQAPEAFRFMARARHVGKIVLRPGNGGTPGDPAGPGWTTHATALVRAVDMRPGFSEGTGLALLEAARGRCPERVEGSDFYAALAGTGNQWGPCFQGMVELWRGPGEAVGRVRVPAAVADELSRYRFHPAVADACGHSFVALARNDSKEGPARGAFVGGGVGEIRYHRPFTGSTLWTHARLRPSAGAQGRVVSGDVSVYDESGRLVSETLDVRLWALDDDDGGAWLGAPDDWFYEVRWHPQELGGARLRGAGAGPWIVLADRDGVAERIAARRAASGGRTILVTPGDAWSIDGDRATIRASEPADFRRLLESVPGPAAVVHLWTIGADEAHALSAGPESVLHLLHGLLAASGEPRPRVWLATSDTQAVVEGDVGAVPFGATLWGMGRTLSVEHAEIWGGMVDLSPRLSPEVAADQVVREIDAGTAEDAVAFRAAGRFVARLERRSATAATNRPFAARPGGTYLLTGGLGGLGLAMARWLVDRGARHLLLVGRSALPPRDAWAGIAPDTATGRRVAAVVALESLGARVETAAVDVAAEGALERCLAARQARGEPPVAGVIHAAGIAEPRALSSQDVGSLRAALSAKLAGGWRLHRAFGPAAPDCFVLCSSGSALLRAPMLGAYAAGNAFLDALAHHRRARGLTALSVNWGAWGEVGMAVEATRGQGRTAPAGTGSISTSRGLLALQDLLGSGVTQAAVMPIDWGELVRAYPALTAAPFLAALVGTAGPKAPARTGQGAALAALRAATAPERTDLLGSYIRSEVARTLGMVPEGLDPAMPLSSLGFDSLMAVQLRNQIERDLGVVVPLIRVLQAPSVEELVAVVLSGLETAGGNGRPVEGASAETWEEGSL